MKCYWCGKELPPESKFCTNCGKPQNFTKDLIQAAVQGEEDAVCELYNRTYNTVYYTVKSMVKDEDAVFDIVQDSYIKGFQNLEHLNKPEKYRSWIKQIAVNKAKDWLKRKKPVLFSELADEETGEELDIQDYRTETLPEEVLEQQEITRLLNEILDSLSEEQRIVIGMFYYEQMSVREIAEILECSENTVKSRLSYGRKKIEIQVKELEKRGTKLYTLAPIPFLLWLFKSQKAQAAEIPNQNILREIRKISKEFGPSPKIEENASGKTVKKAAAVKNPEHTKFHNTNRLPVTGMKKIYSKIIIFFLCLALSGTLGVSLYTREKSNKTETATDVDKDLLLPLPDSATGKFGYKDIKDNWVIEPQYDSADFFTNKDIALVSKDEKAFFIDRKGQIKTQLNIEGSVTRISRQTGPLLSDTAAVSSGYALHDFVNKRLFIRWAVKNTSPKSDNWLDNGPERFHDGFVDENGNVTALPENYNNETFYVTQTMLDSDMFLIYDKDCEKYGYINSNQEVVIPFIYDDLREMSSNGLIAACKDGKYGYINTENEIVIPFVYQNAKTFCYGLAPVKSLEYYGYINEKNEVVIPFLYSAANNFCNGFAHVTLDCRESFLNTKGEAVIPFTYPLVYDSVYNFNDNLLFVVADDRKTGIINTAGETVIPLSSNTDYPIITEAVICRETDTSVSFIDKENNVKLELDAETVTAMDIALPHNVILIVMENNQGLYLDFNGNVLASSSESDTAKEENAESSPAPETHSFQDDVANQYYPSILSEYQTIEQNELYYTLLDLCSDGVPELFISEKTNENSYNIIDIYGYANGSAQHLNIYIGRGTKPLDANGLMGKNYLYTICENNMIKEFQNNGVDQISTIFYQLDANSINLQMIEGATQDGADYYRLFGGGLQAEQIEKEQYDNIKTQYAEKDNITWRKLSELDLQDQTTASGINYKNVYLKLVQTESSSLQGIHYYYLNDMDDDSIPELIIAKGESGATINLYIYSIDTSTQSLYCAGSFFAPLAECYDRGDFPGIAVIGRLGTAEVCEDVLLENKALTRSTSIGQAISIDHYRSKGQLPYYAISDFSPLIN